VVRADKILAGKESAQYLKVVYKYGPSERSLPDNAFDGKSKWRFSLTRDCGCDSSLVDDPSKAENEIAIATWIQTVEGEEVPRNMKLPCYVLRPKGLKPAPEKSHKS